MKVDSFLVRNRQRFKKQVHQKGLAASDVAPQIQTANDVWRFSQAQPIHDAATVCTRFDEASLQICEQADDATLSIVRDQSVGRRVCLFNIQFLALMRCRAYIPVVRSGKDYPARTMPTSAQSVLRKDQPDSPVQPDFQRARMGDRFQPLNEI